MQLNQFEKSVVKHPLRFWLQNRLEAPLLCGLFEEGFASFDTALEIGCGYGNGINVIRQHFGANNVTAIDVDDEMVSATRARFPDAKWLKVQSADASQLPFDTDDFDIVFNFAVFHHIPDWQKALKEVNRVLKPGGFFVIEDLYRNAICNPVSKRLFEHPQTNRFNHKEFLACLRLNGFRVVKSRHLLGLAGMILAQKI